MIDRKKIWWTTLFAVILTLAVFYLTIPGTDILTDKETDNLSEIEPTIKETEVFAALKVERDEEILKEMEELQTVLLNTETNSEDKNNAYETLKDLNLTKGKEELLEQLVKDKFKYENFIKIKGDQISVIIASKTHNEELANKIMRAIQNEFENKMYITVKFET